MNKVNKGEQGEHKHEPPHRDKVADRERAVRVEDDAARAGSGCCRVVGDLLDPIPGPPADIGQR